MRQENEYITDFDGLLALAQDLRQGWDGFVTASDKLTFAQRGHQPHAARFASIYGLAAHVHSLEETAFTLLRDELTLHAIPLVRLMYESALTSVWLANNEDGASAFMNRELASRKAVVATMEKGQSAWMRRNAQNFPVIDDPKFESASDQQAKNFEKLCNDLIPGGADAYLLYRLLSRLSHAGPHVVDRYTFTNQRGDFEGLRGTADAARDSRELVAFIAVASLVWAGRAVDYLDPQRTRRNETRHAARRIGIPRDLDLTPAAHQRIAQHKKSAKRANGG